MKGFIEVYDQRTQFLKDIFLSHGYQINDKQAQNLDFYVVKNQKIDHDNTFSLNNINTKYIINKDSMDLMKKGVVIVNTSRGALINTEDLIEKIKSKKVGAACLDVYEEEGDIFFQDYSGHIVQDDQLARLISMPNVIVTSHQAFLTTEALDNIAKTSIENLINFNKGTPIRENEVCYMCKNQTECKKLLKEKCF